MKVRHLTRTSLNNRVRNRYRDRDRIVSLEITGFDIDTDFDMVDLIRHQNICIMLSPKFERDYKIKSYTTAWS